MERKFKLKDIRIGEIKKVKSSSEFPLFWNDNIDLKDVIYVETNYETQDIPPEEIIPDKAWINL